MNENQLKAADRVLAFLMGEERAMAITGAAGTGKTILLQYIYSYIIPKAGIYNQRNMEGKLSEFWGVQPTGTTHKSVNVLSQLCLNRRKPTTIYSYLGIKVEEEEGQSKLVTGDYPTTSKSFGYPLLLIIDEASMLSQFALDTLGEYLREYSSVKVLFIYDHLQLVPPKSESIPITKYEIPTYELTEYVRSTNPYIDKACSVLRNIVNTGSGLIDSLTTIGMDEFKDKLFKTFKDSVTNSVLVTYTNRETNSWNDVIHDYLTSENKEADYRLIGEAYCYDRSLIRKSIQTKVIPSDSLVKLHPSGLTVLSINPRFININYQIVHPNERHKVLENLRVKCKKHNCWDSYYTYKADTPDLRLPYARTAYKVQGETFKNVFVDLDDIMSCRNRDTRNRLLYVACSRAQHNLYILKR